MALLTQHCLHRTASMAMLLDAAMCTHVLWSAVAGSHRLPGIKSPACWSCCGFISWDIEQQGGNNGSSYAKVMRGGCGNVCGGGGGGRGPSFVGGAGMAVRHEQSYRMKTLMSAGEGGVQVQFRRVAQFARRSGKDLRTACEPLLEQKDRSENVGSM